ncbi:BCCT family transporter [Streptomonospora salina]|uniref:Choline/carnitine/betaine transport n=1 Tax=Streptomonospora salina TaxID=104205 RepID=A0A841EB29_9ACTN|nr:BCCT family transporter [Streptomonospora salina]MBB5998539.1 choline/carnitine/betaine transport [Streptomonospora salina]
MLQNLSRRLGLDTNPFIFSVAAALTVLFVVASIVFTDAIDALFGRASGWILTNLGWFYILGVTTFLIFLIALGLTRYGRVRLGGSDERPEYSTVSWFAMLFAAGIGTILMFWGVAEPISHFAEPPQGAVQPESVAAAEQAMGYTLYHFGLHTWTIFCLPALAFAYFIYKRGLPVRVSSIFHPFLGDRINGPIGRIIDITAVMGTLFGVAVSLGLGTLQINSGLSALFGTAESKTVQVIIIGVITAIAVTSVSLGLDRGVRRLSNINILLAIGLLLFIVATGSPLYLIRGVVESVGIYANWLVPLSFWNDTFGHSGWQGDWTVFYWAWTITWSPFVGIFIARISKGRTLRQFVFGVLGLPTAFTVIWFSVFGLSAFDIQMNGTGGLVREVVEQEDIPGALFAFLENYPLTTLISGLAVVIVAIFFTTSSDSASLVIDMLCSGTEQAGPVRQRVFWAVTEGIVAATLLAATGQSGLDALTTVIIVVGLPFFVMGFLMMVALMKALSEDCRQPRSPEITA